MPPTSTRLLTLAPAILLLLLLSHLLTPTLAQKAVVATITNLDSYSAGRACMRDCIWNLYHRNNCDNTDNCICRLDLQPQITTYISTCVSKSCSGLTRDISSGVSIYQSYCVGKDGQDPVVTPVVTEQVVETTVIERVTVEVTATETQTNFETETVDDVATITRTSFRTDVVDGITTVTRFTATETVRVPSSVTRIEYQTFTAVFNDTESLRDTLGTWGVDDLMGKEKGLTTQGKLAVAFGVGMAGFMVAFLVALGCCLSRRNELMKRGVGAGPGMGGNAGWPEEAAGGKYHG
ncbi:hypothetical protein TWF730_011317 [Orbilia blumenaviensis]|uniref:CFEM domain-containing protein n=1 Tax=Orbilia blumenaviensis TaxID=1796055 RepID=A0AAV9UPH7_9PEZI